ncbi:MAG: VWA domain-containing protein [Myxococcota bacterium]|nr:VWA domain-containing protein [Myxococcota bacterium]
MSARAGAEEYVEPPPPKPLRVAPRLDGDTARFSVRYLVRAEKVANDMTGKFGLPRRGLITVASVTEGGQRHELQLMAADKASAQFHALWETAPGRSRRWAVLIEAEPFASGFTIWSAVPRQTTLVVDVEVAVPGCFQRDARYVLAPTEWVSRLPASMHTGATEAEEIQIACGGERSHELEGMSWVKFPSRELAERRGGADRIGTYAGRTLLGKTNIVKLELNLARRVSEVPADLATAIVVDASRSTTPEELEAQRETIAAYLRAAPNGRVQVIEYARYARALLPSWTTARQATPRIERELRAMQRKNGSNIAEGLREAGRWLDQTTGTRRILLFTDEHLTVRDEHTRAVDDAIPANTLVHVVSLGGEGLARDDAAKLARVAKQTKGMSVRGGDAPRDDDQRIGKLDATLLARPTTFDHVRVRTPGWKALTTEHPCPETEEDVVTSFAEGSQCTWWGQGDAVSSPFVVEGFLWGERVERVLRADLGRSLEVVRELSAMHVLEEDLQKLAERAARAVNSVWSMYTSWGGDDGYSDGFGMGRGGFGITCGSCNGGLIGHGTGTGTFVGQPDLAIELARIVRTCKPEQPVDVEVETTLEEIVDVEVKAVSADLRTCVQDALWNASLVVPGAPARTITRFSVKPT